MDRLRCTGAVVVSGWLALTALPACSSSVCPPEDVQLSFLELCYRPETLPQLITAVRDLGGVVVVGATTDNPFVPQDPYVKPPVEAGYAYVTETHVVGEVAVSDALGEDVLSPLAVRAWTGFEYRSRIRAEGEPRVLLLRPDPFGSDAYWLEWSTYLSGTTLVSPGTFGSPPDDITLDEIRR
jgi:hypothetical protein